MTTFNPETIIRKNLLTLKPYSSARNEYQGNTGVLLDANENSFTDGDRYQQNRYPDPNQFALKKAIGKLKNISIDDIFLGNGSDEAIDLLIRLVCTPNTGDNILICPPTYGMYEVAASINDISVKTIALNREFQLDVQGIMDNVDEGTKLIFLCSPNNPTGNLLNQQDIEMLLYTFQGLIVLDEAYIDFTAGQSWLPKLQQYPNLVILQTFSKAWGMAGIRLGMAFGDKRLITVLNKIKLPYNINCFSQATAIEAINNPSDFEKWRTECLIQRQKLEDELNTLSCVKKVFLSDANFLLVRFTNAAAIYAYLEERDIIVRNRSNVPGCTNCLRITVGTDAENQLLITTIKSWNT